MPQPPALPGRKDQDAGYVIVIPRHFLFAEETDDLAVGCVGRGGARGATRGARRLGFEDESVVQEGGSIEEDGFRFEEEFGEEGEVLCVELHITYLLIS